MQIHGFHSGNVDRINARHAATDGSKKDISAPQQNASDVGQTHTRSPELLRLSEALHRIPELRQDIVERVSQKLVAGEYETRESAEKTAEALLRQL
jgi:hypothetical protein